MNRSVAALACVVGPWANASRARAACVKQPLAGAGVPLTELVGPKGVGAEQLTAVVECTVHVGADAWTSGVLG